ncbi:MAG: class I SAM-dependent methyltransferase [Anaerolineales bacterium]|nr:class I SAM-dependent methyltransferase [Anaerolineales bacterium]
MKSLNDQDAAIKTQVREFYDSIGWKQVGDGIFQNARYEDLRPVSQEYIQRCHERISRYLPADGKYMLDAGSGPIQYPAYLAYSQGFERRVCLDISYLALVEARNRIGDHGWFVVGDAARLPFRADAFDALVSMHTVHHLPPQEQIHAYHDFLRVIKPDASAVVVNSWGPYSLFMKLASPFVQLNFALIRLYRNWIRRESPSHSAAQPEKVESTGTHVYRYGPRWLKENLADLPDLEVRAWRSVSTSFLRACIHRRLLGRMWLRIIYWLEETFPHLMGRGGQYALIRFRKPGQS